MTVAQFGRINDIDSHEQVPANLWMEHFGEAVAPMVRAFGQATQGAVQQNTFAELVTADDTPITPETLWSVKSSRAASAIDMQRRLEVLDFTGTRQSLIFPTGPGLVGLIVAMGQKWMVEKALGVSLELDDPLTTGRSMCRAYNDWCLRTAALDVRLRPVATIDPTDLDAAIAEIERVAAGGVRAIMLPAGTPVAGMSPAHPDVDRLWALLEEARIPVLLHVGGEAGFLASLDWANAPQFHGTKGDSAELVLDPYTLSVNHFGVQNYLTALIVGGVFERFPELRVGCIEVTAHWIGPMAENIGMWLDRFPKRMAGKLSLTPEEYLERNVRISALYWEPVDRYIDRFGMESIYCYGSDYPHVESGPVDPVPVWADRLAGLGPETLERFFVTNGELLFP